MSLACVLAPLLLLPAAPPSPAAAASVPLLPREERVEALRAVERARYTFTLEATKPFDEVHPRAGFEKQADRQALEEKVLLKSFAMAPTRKAMAAEYERIEKGSQAPEQWEAIKRALGNDRRKVEEIVCRQLLVSRALRARFEADLTLHAREHQKARDARAAFLAREVPAGARRMRLARGGSAPTSDPTREMLDQAKAQAQGPKVTGGEKEKAEPKEAAVPVEPEKAAVLERELVKPGDVTTILAERDRFSVYRLIAADPSEWTVLAVEVPKRPFDSWFEAEASRLAAGARPKGR